MRLFAGIVAAVLAVGCTPGQLENQQPAATGGSGGSGSGGSGGGIDAPDMPDAEPPDTLPACSGGDNNGADPVSGHCFMFFTGPKTWYDAFTACQSVGPNVHLATLTDAQQDSVAQMLNGQTLAWFGYDDRTVEGQWNWITSEISGYTDWGTGQPNGGAAQNCAALDPGLANKWNDKACTDQYGYLCERDSAM